jgi:flagellar biosynthetic protein FliO
MDEIQSVAGQVLSFVMFILGFAVVIVLAYISTKYAGRKLSLKNGGTGNIKIIDKVALGTDKSLVIVQSAGKTMLIGVTSQHIEFISELDESMISVVSADNSQTQDFYSVLKKSFENINLKKVKKINSKENTDEKKQDSD